MKCNPGGVCVTTVRLYPVPLLILRPGRCLIKSQNPNPKSQVGVWSLVLGIYPQGLVSKTSSETGAFLAGILSQFRKILSVGWKPE